MRSIVGCICVSLFLLILTASITAPAEAQILRRLRDRAKAKVEQKAGEKQVEAIDRVLDGKPEDAAAPDAASEPAAEATEPAEGAGTPEAAATEPAKLNPGQGAWANFDFVPGERVLFAEDFSKDRVGNFPKRFEFLSGNAEVVAWEGRKWLRSNDETYFKLPLPEVLPERFTVEFDVTVPWWGMEFHADATFDERYNRNTFETSAITLGCCEAGVYRGQGDATSTVDPCEFFKGMYSETNLSRPFRVRLHVDGSYVKLYLDEKRVANMPNASFGRQSYLAFRMSGSAEEERAPLITGFSINAGGSPMYDALMADGRFATQGILFDTGSDRIRPESTPTLKEIGDMLCEHADLRLLIEGHTDNVGTPETNQGLSERRAAAVRGFLIEAYKIDDGRLEAKGFGATTPAATNDTPEGRQQNRRVELVKL
jgi:OOP family OmpA-OmpF porin